MSDTPLRNYLYRGHAGSERLLVGCGAMIALLGVGWLVWRTDWRTLKQVVWSADWRFVILICAVVLLEQALRAIKWRQILLTVKPVPIRRIFPAILAGYAAGIIVPFGVSPVVRAYIVAQLEKLDTMTVLATVAIDRIIDAGVFLAIAAAALVLYTLPTINHELGSRLGGSLIALSIALAIIATGLIKLRADILQSGRWTAALHKWIPSRFTNSAIRYARQFALGIVLPREWYRKTLVVITSLLMRAMTVLLFIFAGRAVGIEFSMSQGLFLIVIPGLFYALSRVLRIPGGFVFGGVIALTAIGLSNEIAVAIMLLIHFTTAGVIALFGLPVLALNGIDISRTRRITSSER